MSLSIRTTLILCTVGTTIACAKGPQGTSDTTNAPAAASGQPAHAASNPAAKPANEGSTTGLSSRDRSAVDKDGVVRRGMALSDTPLLTVAQAHAQSATLDGKHVKLTGEVSQVCQNSGCWFILREGDQNVRITSKGYKYFVPSDAPGMTAVVEGVLAVQTLAIKAAQHYEDDAAAATGKPAKQILAPQREISIASIGLEMKKS